MAGIQTVDPNSLLTVPAGWDVASANDYGLVAMANSGANPQVVTDAVEFWSLSAFGHTIGNVPNADAQIAQAASQNGSTLLGTVVLHTTDFNVTLPATFTIPTTIFGVPVPGGGTEVPIPGGGTTLAQVDRYRHVSIHQQVVLLWIIVPILVSILGAVLIASFTGNSTALNNLNNSLHQFFGDIATAAGGGQAAAITNTVIAWSVFGLIAALGSWAVIKKVTGKAPPAPRIIQAPQLPAVGPVYQTALSTARQSAHAVRALS